MEIKYSIGNCRTHAFVMEMV